MTSVVSSPQSAQPAPPASPVAAGAIVSLSGRYAAKPGSKVRIAGTSNIHDWQVAGSVIGGVLELGAGFPLDVAKARPGAGSMSPKRDPVQLRPRPRSASRAAR